METESSRNILLHIELSISLYLQVGNKIAKDS
jgi:hypothetical protein